MLRDSPKMVLSLWWCFLVVPKIAIAQTKQDAPSDSRVVIRSTTNLVQVHVAVVDSHGRPVSGLQRSDFQILDDRKPQTVTLFEPDDVSPPLPAEGPDQQSNASTKVA
jgi:hypothetical protein